MLLFAGLWSWSALSERWAHTAPPYAQRPIASLLEQTVLSEADYAALFLQTGLGRQGVDGVRAESGAEGILQMQAQLFAQTRWQCGRGTLLTRQEELSAPVRLAPLQNGDVLATPASHCLGWRNGHIGLVVDADRGLTLECTPGGAQPGRVEDWRRRASFIVLRLADTDRSRRAQIARWAQENLQNLPYSITAGVFDQRDGAPAATQCAHMVWAAYAAFGYDLDSNGGLLVLPEDLARSPLLEVVQVYGMPPGARWAGKPKHGGA